MYESKTYENLMREKIEFIQNLAQKLGIAIDTRTASMIFFAVAANSYETGQSYIELEQVLNESFAARFRADERDNFPVMPCDKID